MVAQLRTVTRLAVGAALGGFLFGYDTAVINGAVPALRAHFGAGAWAIGLSVSLALLGSALGAFAAGPLADRRGRVPSMRVAASLFFVSAIGSGLPVTLYDFIVWRVIGGIGVGMASVLAPAYIAEIAPAAYRGRLGSLQQLAIVLGIFLSGLSNYALGQAAGGASGAFWGGFEAWRWMFWAEVIPAVAYGFFSLQLPESPRYLLARGDETAARDVLAATLGHDTDLDRKMAAISAECAKEPARFSDLRGPALGLLPVVWVGVGLSVFQQFVGINVIFYYSNALWQTVGFDESNALAISLISNTTNVVTTFIAIASIDRFGRRPLLLAGSVGMSVSLGLVAWALSTATPDATGRLVLGDTAGVVALVAANAFVFAFGFSWGPVVCVLLGEMFDNQRRAAALALAASVQWVANFAISTTFPPMVDAFGSSGAYVAYATFAALSFFFVKRWVPETKGQELERA